MLYCTSCGLITDGPCPRCGRSSDKLRAPRPEDPVFLISCRTLQAAMLEPLLKENNIPYYRSGALGAALATKLGSLFELYSIYVSWESYQQARDLIIGIFGNDPDIMARFENYDTQA